jgi:hypothetical protein
MLQRRWIVALMCMFIAVGTNCKQDKPEDRVILPLQEASVLQIGRPSAEALLKDLKGHLLEAWDENDPVAALEFCTLEALALTEAVEKRLPEGVKLKRTSFKFRNPKNAPDPIDSDALDHFSGALDKDGELPKHLVLYVEEDKAYRYYQPLKMGNLCLNCHGHLEQMDREIIASLKENYPQDMATGYQVGDFRGLIRVSIPENQIAAAGERPYLKAAQEAARWIGASALETEEGKTWPAVPGDPKTINNTLYSGNPGVVLFYLEAYNTTGEKSFLNEAEAGADYLLATLSQENLTGLYSGLSGVGYALAETYRFSKKDKYLEGMQRCLEFLEDRAVDKGRGVQWSDTTDIISGNAGTGLFLLYAAGVLDEPAWIALAERAGQRLCELGQETEGGLKWAMHPEYPRLMPNFSHGTAGIAYFLGRLYQETRKQEFLDSALAGARYLLEVAEVEDNGCLIFHHEPGGEDLFYLGWCHGPVGTARLFYLLHQITGEKEWLTWMERGARSLLQSGIPEKETPGFWNNVGVCCGSAGVADFILSLHEIDPHPEYLDFVMRLTSDLLARGTRDENGLRWIQAEHRSRPDFLQAQTGLMQGAAGIGLWFLRLDAYKQGKHVSIFLPDTPFGE